MHKILLSDFFFNICYKTRTKGHGSAPKASISHEYRDITALFATGRKFNSFN